MLNCSKLAIETWIVNWHFDKIDKLKNKKAVKWTSNDVSFIINLKNVAWKYYTCTYTFSLC